MSKSSPLSAFTPTQLFGGGIVAGILVLCTLGFFILLSMYLKGVKPSALAANQPTAPAAYDDTGAPQGPVTVSPVDPNNDHIRGNVNSKVTVVEYSDLECPFCKRFHVTMQQVMQKYGNDIRWVYRHMPLDSLHQQARPEALASECAAEQGKFWEFIDLVFAETTSNDGLDLAKLPTYARQVGLNVNQFQQCYDSQKYASAVQEDEASALAAGAQGTPYSVVVGPNGETTVLNGAQPVEEVERAIQAYL